MSTASGRSPVDKLTLGVSSDSSLLLPPGGRLTTHTVITATGARLTMFILSIMLK